MTGADATGGSRLGDSTGLADLAIACLAEPVRARHSRPVFSTDLSVDEAILLEETGYEPRRLVMGCSIFHVGWVRTASGYGEGELVPVTQAMYDARALATRRLTHDAQAAGGEAVIGVRLGVRSHGHLAEFTAIGTAIAPREGHPRRRRGAPAALVTTDLSGQDFYMLDRAGYEPLGLVFGNCVYYAPPNWASFSTSNVELDAPTRALSRARELAMTRLQEEAARLGALGVVGVTVSEHAHAFWRGGIEFLAIGTAVRLRRGDSGEPGAHAPVEIRMVVEMEDARVAADPGAISGHAGKGADPAGE